LELIQPVIGKETVREIAHEVIPSSAGALLASLIISRCYDPYLQQNRYGIDGISASPLGAFENSNADAAVKVST
jgi:hypothetical protein